jgi:hypothetical protein
MEGCKEMSGEDGAKVSVLKELLQRMYKLMAMDKPKGEEMAMEGEEDDDDGMLSEVAEDTMEEVAAPKKKLPKYAMLGMSLKTKEAPKPAMMMGKGKRYG